MYVHPAFKVHPAAALAFAAARGFGVVIACDAGRPVGAHLPFRVIEQDGKVPKLEIRRRLEAAGVALPASPTAVCSPA